MLRNGSIAGMILISVALLAGLVAAGPLFGSATNAGGLSRRLAAIPDTTVASLRPMLEVTVRNGPVATVEPQIKALVEAVPYLDRPQTAVYGDAWHLDYRHPTPYALAGTRLPAVLYHRTGAVEALDVVSGTGAHPGSGCRRHGRGPQAHSGIDPGGGQDLPVHGAGLRGAVPPPER